MNISDRIQSLRKARGITQEQLADAVGVSRQAVSKCEAEQSVPDLERVVAMAEYFDVTTDYLLRGIEPAPKKGSGSRVSPRTMCIIATALDAAGLIIGVLIGNVCMKNLVARSRPCWREPSVKLLISNPRDYSFPSGHTLSSTIAAVIITSANRKFGYAAIPLASAISFSRLYLYVHFPSDVLGASCLGLVLASVVLHFGLQL